MKQLWTKLYTGVGALLAWIKSTYSELSGQGSSTRLHCGLVIVTGCFIAIYLAVKNQNASHLPSVAAFMATTCTALYTANRYFNNKDLASANKPDPSDLKPGQSN